MANPAHSAVLHLLNIQTGSWVHDPLKYKERSPWESLKFHVGQSLGVDMEKDSQYMLTDGTHVEDLGLYVLLQRRCTLIVASDCSQEERSQKPSRRFDALAQVLQQASVDGIEIGPFLSSRAFWLKPDEDLSLDVADAVLSTQEVDGARSRPARPTQKRTGRRRARRVILKSRNNRTSPRSPRRRAIQNSAPPGGTRSPPG